MKTKQLGNSDLFITPVGFGAWAIGGSGWEFAWGAQDDNASIAAIHRALELGVNWIDTAAVYGTGHSEEVVARALEASQESVDERRRVLQTEAEIYGSMGDLVDDVRSNPDDKKKR